MDKIHLLSTMYLCPTIKRYKFNTFKWNLIQSNCITKNHENIIIKLLFRVWPKIVWKKKKSGDISLLPCLLQMQWTKLLKSNDNYSSEFRCFPQLINYFRELNSCLGNSTAYSNSLITSVGLKVPSVEQTSSSGITQESNSDNMNQITQVKTLESKMSGRIYKS